MPRAMSGEPRIGIAIARDHDENADMLKIDSSPGPVGSAGATRLSLAQLFTGFFAISISAVGGALPWARYALVERRQWLSPAAFTETIALCQFLPGPNIVNLAVAVGARFQGARGALAALAGLLTPAFCLVLVLGQLYFRFGGVAALHGVFGAIASAAAGLILAMGAKMATPALRARPATAAPFIVATFVLAGLLRLPLGWVLLGLAPLSIATARGLRR